MTEELSGGIGSVEQVRIEEQMRTAYLEYAVSVIVGRAFPDARDGLKPVQRRILYTMWEEGIRSTAQYKKSARTVGTVLAKYHPHGELAVYDAMVRMAQPFSLRYPLIDGQGNFGCFVGSTRVRLADGTTRSFEELVADDEQGKTHHTYAIDDTGRAVMAPIKAPRLTKRGVPVVRVTLDNGEAVVCTPDHRFMLRDGTYREAQHLRPGESLMPLYTRLYQDDDRNLRGYEQVYQPATDTWEFAHLVADELNVAQGVYLASAGRVRHHGSVEKAKEAALAHTTPLNHRAVSVQAAGRADVYDLTVDDHHNFALAAGIIVHNSVDNDPPAAMRYTEARLTAIAEELMADIDKETVEFLDNFDAQEQEPLPLPAKLPNLLLNGAEGIAVGMATKIPPHNLAELVDGIAYLIDRPDATVDELLRLIPGPDFPTAGLIMGTAGIRSAYATGKGRVVMRARAEIEEGEHDRRRIVVSELPYQVNKAALQEKIADLVGEKRLEGISNLRDESDRRGMRLVIELRRDARPQAVLNQLFKHTALQSAFNVNMVAVVGQQPQVLTLKSALQQYVAYRQEIVTRRTRFDLRRARERTHVLEGLQIALDHLDAVIRTIREAQSTEEARAQLGARFGLSEVQANAILDLQLRRLVALERQRLAEELGELRRAIADLEDILARPERVLVIIKEELAQLKDKYGDRRRTVILPDEEGELTEQDLVARQDVLVLLTDRGYVKRMLPAAYRVQNRGGKGVSGVVTREDDGVRQLFTASTHDNVLFFTNRGRVLRTRVWELPDVQRQARGSALINLIALDPEERVTTCLPIDDFEAGGYLVLATRRGEIKRTALAEYASVRQNGIKTMDVEEGDELCWVVRTSGEDELILVSAGGQSLTCAEGELRVSGRTSGGVRGIRLEEGDGLVALQVVDPAGALLMITGNGIGKKTPFGEFRRQARGGGGVRAIVLDERTGPLVAALAVGADTQELVAISRQGQVIRVPVQSVKSLHRAARGVQLMRVAPGESVVALARLGAQQEDGAPSENGAGADAAALAGGEAPTDEDQAEGGEATEVEAAAVEAEGA
jgi:DNA gyrase subunit A